MSDETASTDALRRDDPVVEHSIPGEAVEAFPGEIIAPQAMEECRLLFMSLIDLAWRSGGQRGTVLEETDVARSYIRELTTICESVTKSGGFIRLAGRYRGDDERVERGLGPMNFLEKLHSEQFMITFAHEKQEYGFGRVNLDLLRFYRSCPAVIPIGGYMRYATKVEALNMRLDFPLACFKDCMFSVKIGDAARTVLCVYIGSVKGQDPSLMEVVPPVELAVMLRGDKLYLMSPDFCGQCGAEEPCLKGIKLKKCTGCGHGYYCGTACQLLAWRRDHGPVRKDGSSRPAHVPSIGWCQHFAKKKSGYIFPVLDYDTYVSHERGDTTV
jgi:hypothetical protein